jgi:competence protein ComGC
MATKGNERAFTRIELMIVLVVIVLLGLVLLPAFDRANHAAAITYCVNNLKQLGTATRIWENDHGKQLPLVSTNGGAFIWKTYLESAKDFTLVLICPTDERTPAKTIDSIANTNVSYFCGVVADDAYPQSLLGGDRNLGPGTIPDPEYGFSPTNGKGNDVVIKGSVCWSKKMHTREVGANCGNILLGDGSVQQAATATLNAVWLTNTLANSTNGGIHLIFP